MKRISIVIPIYNEESNIRLISEKVAHTMKLMDANYELIFIDDGSQDKTLEILKALHEEQPHIKFISLSRNFGHQAALKAGLDHATGDIIISMDGDLQHPPDLLPKLVEKHEEGYDIVYTVRQDCEETGFFKKLFSDGFYWVLNRLSGIQIEKGCADFRLISRQVATQLCSLKEYDLFYRGLVKWIGFRQFAITYQASKRANGKSKYTWRKMIRLAAYAILSFSTKPLYYTIYLGLTIALLSILYLPYVLISLYNGETISGWASILITIAFFGGLQLVVMGTIGLYIGRIYLQVKQRPVYIVKEENLA